jgi:dihydropteroate synthase
MIPPWALIVAARGAALILMHTRGRSRDMYVEARYDDVVSDVARELQLSMQRAIEHGVAFDRLVIDPGLGFAKTAAQHDCSRISRRSPRLAARCCLDPPESRS